MAIGPVRSLLQMFSMSKKQRAAEAAKGIASATQQHSTAPRPDKILPAPVSMDVLGQAPLRTMDGQEITASQLWADQPTVVMVIRRPGCVLCRDEAKKLWAIHGQFQAMGVSLVAVVHEWIDQEIQSFAPEYWGGPLYHDTSKAFYKYVGGGQLKYGNPLVFGNPFGDIWARVSVARNNVNMSNLNGEGFIMGGLLVVGARGTGPYLTHLESDFGIHPQHTEVLEAASRAASSQREE